MKLSIAKNFLRSIIKNIYMYIYKTFVILSLFSRFG